MVPIKTVLTVRYTPILNLGYIIRDIAAPYLLYSEAKIDNAGHPAERVLLTFEEEGYLIDCNWLRIAFGGQGTRIGYEDENGPLRFFFEMVQRLESLKDFGKIKDVKLETWDVIDESEGALQDPLTFKNQYLSKHPFSTIGDLDDLAVNLVYKNSSRSWAWSFGPYRQKADLDKHKLLFFPQRNVNDFVGIKGILASVDVTDTSSKVSHKLYRSLYKDTQDILSGIV